MKKRNLVYSAYVISVALSLAFFSSPAKAQAIEPCGGASQDLWSWAWAGINGSNVTTSQNNFGTEISFMGDLSGNGNDYFNNDPFDQDPPTRPAYLSSFSMNGYSTSFPVVGSGRYDTGKEAYIQWMFNAEDMIAPGEFYLAFAGYDSRSDGQRIIWGTTASNFVRYDQLENSINITINGQSAILTAKDAWEDGPILIEVWRDASNNIHTWVNGFDKTSGIPSISGTFRLNGIGGGDPAGDNGFDDTAFEYIACDGLPTAEQRAEVRDYLRSKWTLFGAGSAPKTPEAPANFVAE